MVRHRERPGAGPRRLGPALMPLAANALGAFLMTGQFRLTMRRPAAVS